MSKLILTLANATIYSSALSATIYYRDSEFWTLEKCGYLGLFWVGFMIPSGIVWGQINRIAVKALNLPAKYTGANNTLSLNYYLSKKALFTDLLLNHGVYSLITVAGIYYFFNDIKPDIFNININNEKSIQGEQQQNNQLDNKDKNTEVQSIEDTTADIMKKNGIELFQTRWRLSMFSLLWDIWFPQYILKKSFSDTIQLGKQALRIHKFKEIMIILLWQHTIIQSYNMYQKKTNQLKSEQSDDVKK